MNPVLTVYPQKPLSKHHYSASSEKRSFPDELSAFQQRAGFEFKELDNCVLYFHLVFDDEAKLAKILEFIRVDDDLHVQLQYSGMSLPLPQ